MEYIPHINVVIVVSVGPK